MKFNSLVVLVIVVASCLVPSKSRAAMGDDPLLTKVMSEFEYLPSEENGALEWDVDAWIGRDLSKFWVKTSGELVREESTDVESANIELVYSRAAYTTWDQQFGVRHDIEPDGAGASRARNWLSFGYIGTAPYFVEVDARIFIGEESSSQLLVELEREIMLTQEWVLTPELDIIANGRSNEAFGEGSGLSEIEFSIRLGYEHDGNRKFQPFLGLSSKQTFGGTRRFTKQKGQKSGDLNLIFGIHSWF